MVSVLNLIGYGPVESLQIFLSRFIGPSSITTLDEELEKIWISHRNIGKLNGFVSSFNDDHFKIECKKIHSNPYAELDFVLNENSQNQFSSQRILERILTKLHCCLAQYVITECLLLYNWGTNSFELVLQNEEFCMRLLKNQNHCKRKWLFRNDEDDFRKWRMILTSRRKNSRLRRNSCDLFEEEERKMLNSCKRRKRKCSNYHQLERIFRECDRPWRWESTTNMDVFNKNSILYDMKQRLWPKKHASSSSTPEEFLNAIMKVEIKEKENGRNGLSHINGNQWHALKRILGLFLKNHKSLVVCDGYGRLLKRHLKVTGFTRDKSSNRRLKPIPSNSVSSYISIVLNKVVPFEFFGWNRVRKKFLRETSRIVLGGKWENFILKPLIQTFSDVKNNLTWIREIQGWEVARRIITKILKWLLFDYVFLILKNNFYITEVGSSGYRLYYYRKSDFEGAVSRWVNNQIRMENLRIVKGDLDHWKSVERNWLETGKVELNRNDRGMKMDKKTEFIYPVSNARFMPKNVENDDLRIITSYRIKKTILGNGDGEKKKLAGMFMERHVKRILMFRKVKLLLRFLTDKYGNGISPLPNNPKLELAWMKAVHLKEVYGKLYYIKADVSDAFGSVLPSLLGAIIEEKLRVKSNQVLQLKKIKECRARNGGIVCGIRKSFSNKPMENSLLVSRSIFVGLRKKLPSYSSNQLKEILDQIIHWQYVRINGQNYRLTRGLTQGSAGSISPLLCDLYYSEMDRRYFGEFTSCKDCILLRAVDDYLFLTSDIDKARKFYEIVYKGIDDFNVRFNRDKLASNLFDASNSSVNYLGLIFDVENSSVRPDFGRYGRKNFLSTMKLSDSYGTMFSRQIRFIQSRSTGIVPLKLLPVTLNGLYNNPSVVRKIVYAASIVQSNRILVLVRHLIRWRDRNDLDLCVVMSKSLRKICSVVIRLNRNATKLEISWLFWRGALEVFRKFSGFFPNLLTLIRHRINVSEMSFRRSGLDGLLNSMKGELAKGAGWDELRGTLKTITARSKPSKRFR